jgi:ferredoxin
MKETEMVMRVVVDLDKCLGYANCVVDAPEVFEIPDDQMVVRLLQPTPDEALRAGVEQAVLDCPAQAITIVDAGAGEDDGAGDGVAGEGR